jgi:hypothetical protein
VIYIILTRVPLNGIDTGPGLPIWGTPAFGSISKFTVPSTSENLQTIVSEPRLSSINRAVNSIVFWPQLLLQVAVFYNSHQPTLKLHE